MSQKIERNCNYTRIALLKKPKFHKNVIGTKMKKKIVFLI